MKPLELIKKLIRRDVKDIVIYNISYDDCCNFINKSSHLRTLATIRTCKTPKVFSEHFSDFSIYPSPSTLWSRVPTIAQYKARFAFRMPIDHNDQVRNITKDTTGITFIEQEKKQEDSHKGQIYNPYTKTWSWL
jgi:hypothetical protein